MKIYSFDIHNVMRGLTAGLILGFGPWPATAEEGHDHASAPAGDAALAEPCEHKVPIAECPECRYEVGVVALDPKVGPNLVQRAVVEKAALARRLRLLGEVQADPQRVVPVRAPVPLSWTLPWASTSFV